MKTVDQWLAIPKAKLGLELAKVFTPGLRKHEPMKDSGICKRCGARPMIWCEGKPFYDNDSCDPPDPIDIESWDAAMKWRDKTINGVLLFEIHGDILISMHDIWEIRAGYYGKRDWRKIMFMWWALYATAKDWLILAAAMATERKEV